MNNPKPHAWFAAGIVLTVLAVSIAAGAFNPVRAQYWQTWRWLHSIENIVEDYHREHGHYPSSLADVPQAEAYRQGPIEYRREGESYVLVSFGTDNKPGGLGDAADVYLPESRQPPTAWYEYFFTNDFVVASEDGLLWGVLAAALWLVTRWRRKPPFPPLTFDDAIRSAVAVGLACLVAVGVLALHIGVDVSGH